MARPCKQNGRSKRAIESAAGHCWGWEKERKTKKEMAG
jgi:hypothetical protein